MGACASDDPYQFGEELDPNFPGWELGIPVPGPDSRKEQEWHSLYRTTAGRWIVSVRLDDQGNWRNIDIGPEKAAELLETCGHAVPDILIAERIPPWIAIPSTSADNSTGWIIATQGRLLGMLGYSPNWQGKLEELAKAKVIRFAVEQTAGGKRPRYAVHRDGIENHRKQYPDKTPKENCEILPVGGPLPSSYKIVE